MTKELEKWEPIRYCDVVDGYEVSSLGKIRGPDVDEHFPTYHSSNGYDYDWIMTKDGRLKLYPIDEIIGLAFNPPDKLFIGYPIKIIHLDKNNRNNDYNNLKWVIDQEEWRPLVYDGMKPDMYLISNHGRVMNVLSGRILSTSISKKGYIVAGIMRNVGVGEHVYSGTIQIHRAVANAFIKHCDLTMNQVNHIDGCKLNCRPKNLEWTNNLENQLHAQKSGLVKPRPSKISTEVVDYVREMLLELDSPIKVYNSIDHDKYPEITLDIIRDIRRGRKTYNRSNKYNLDDVHFSRLQTSPPINLGKIPVDDIDNIRMILMENGGSIINTFNRLLDTGIVDISKYTIAGVKYGTQYLRSNKYDLTKSTKYPWVLINN